MSGTESGNIFIIIGRKSINQFSKHLQTAAELSTGIIYVKINPTPNFNEIVLVRDLYYEATNVCGSRDVRILLDDNIDKDCSTVIDDNLVPGCYNGSVLEKPYKSVVLGGTFDRLHNGHKVLLSGAILVASKRIVCGVTYGEQNTKKCLWEMMQPLDARMNGVKEFVEDVSNVRCETHPILDAFGPSTVDVNLEAIVVTPETYKGGQAVNQERWKKRLSLLEIRVVPLVSSSDDVLAETKLSSSSLRRARLGRLLHHIDATNYQKPFIIVCIGCAGSGKSQVAGILADKGCQVIDCDDLISKLCHDNSAFIKCVRDSGGTTPSLDDEKALSALQKYAFSTEEGAKSLADAVLPFVTAEVENLIKQSASDIVVIKAPSLPRLQFSHVVPVQQTWCCLTSLDAAVGRVLELGSLTQKEAEEHVKSQLGNCESVQKSDVIISTMWGPEETERQVIKAFDELRALRPRPSTQA